MLSIHFLGMTQKRLLLIRKAMEARRFLEQQIWPSYNDVQKGFYDVDITYIKSSYPFELESLGLGSEF